jgi:hypothetical protein
VRAAKLSSKRLRPYVAVRATCLWRERLAWASAAVFVLTTIAFAIGFVLRAPKPPQPMRLSAEIGADASLYTAIGPSAILSPDGTRLALVAAGSGKLVPRPLRSSTSLSVLLSSACHLLKRGSLPGTGPVGKNRLVMFFGDRVN